MMRTQLFKQRSLPTWKHDYAFLSVFPARP